MADLETIKWISGIGLFFLGLMFTWLKWDVNSLSKKMDGHLIYHLTKKEDEETRI